MGRREIGFIKSVRIDASAGGDVRLAPALTHVDEIALDPSVTFLVGPNGSGKSTLLEAIAIKAGLNAEGGGRSFRFASQETHSELHRHVTLSKLGTPATDFFLRAESFYNVATMVDSLGAQAFYGGRSLHAQSHGESFLSLVIDRFGPDGLYLLDEPEAALSPQGQLTLLRRVHELAESSAQLIIATHSPVLVALPGATILQLGDSGVDTVGYDDVEHVQLYRAFLDAPERYLRLLLADD